ncbi:LPS export ABC transporter periplasmic protein LptC [Methylomonas paludis]|uniref:LPS export ABC transporter periplasmic protein LptC n=1 Tax=Methylomonas paludis TaxID=1173101 RepID=A0A975MNL5_9GAMM|nr:LPS export ABC transporter periplasmic protein LptC [Methylomonas paludis]QWF71173.1 LPS export ABC transporter periplasmic protein LptC [Methylomonas paludis]
MMVWQELKLYLGLIIVALLSWGLVRWNQERDVEMKIAENNLDFFSSGYYKKQMDSEGLPKNQLYADKMQHQKTDGATYLEKPVMTLYNRTGQSPWLIKSETAVLAADGDNLKLNGQTLISREVSARNSALTIHTADLQVKLDRNYAETQAWAEIISPPNQTSGTGMEVTFVSPINLNLLAKVKGRYELN